MVHGCAPQENSVLAKLKDFAVVCIQSSGALSDRDLSTLRETITGLKPDFWEETEPGTFLAFFLVTRGGRTKSLKLSAAVGSLRKQGSGFAGVGVAKTVGELVTEANWYGKILTCPFGDAVNQAMKLAREAAQKETRA
jgi:hypothetical protein